MNTFRIARLIVLASLGASAAAWAADNDKVEESVVSLEMAKLVTFDAFGSGRVLSKLRPATARPLSAVEFEQLDAAGKVVARSRMRMQALQDGLEHYLHELVNLEEPDVTQLEAGIVAGGHAIGLVYTDSRFSKGKPVAIEQLVPSQVKVVQGNPFAAANLWSLSVIDARTGDRDIETCKAERRVEAASLHAALVGKAVLYACSRDSDPSYVALRWYLVDYARYLPAGGRDGAEVTITHRFVTMTP